MFLARNIPDAKAAVAKEWKKLEKLSAWQENKSKAKKKKVIEQADKEGQTVHFATVMDFNHLKDFQKYKGRRAPR